jgi:hypothetical protein
MYKQSRDFMLGSGAENAREGYGDGQPGGLARKIKKQPRFNVKETTWRPSSEAVPAQAQRERRIGKSKAA